MVTTKWGPVTDKKVDPNRWIYSSTALDVVEESKGGSSSNPAVHLPQSRLWEATSGWLPGSIVIKCVRRVS